MKQKHTELEEKVDYKGMIVMDNDLYELDKSAMMLRLHKYPSAQLSLLDLMEDGNYLVGRYVPKHKTFAKKGFNYQYEIEINIPKVMLEQGTELSNREIIAINKERFVNGHGFLIVDNELSDRLNGKLPVTLIDGKKYIVDIENLELRQELSPATKFRFEWRDMIYQKLQYYNTATGTPADILPGQDPLPEHIVEIVFPSLRAFDLVGCNVKRGYSPTTLLDRLSWKVDLFKPEMIHRPAVGKDQHIDLIKPETLQQEKLLKRKDRLLEISKINLQRKDKKTRNGRKTGL